MKAQPNRKRLISVLYVLLCIACLLGGSFFGWINKSQVLATISRQILTRSQPKDVFKDKDSLTVLLLGCDEDRAPGGKRILVDSARSDMIFVAKVNFKTNEITGVSIPRDLKVQLAGYRDEKINHYYKFGGKELSKRAVESVIHCPIDKVIAINTKILQDMVDLIGGITIDIPKKMKWTDRRGDLYIDLHPGRQKLDGYNAMCFVRYRRDSDTDRQRRQREFLLAYRDELIKNPSAIPAVVDKFKQLVADDFSVEEFAALALFITRLKSENIRMGMIPARVAGHYFLRIDESKLFDTLREYKLLPSTDTTDH
jgi:LCP family protein required for cell wall assembly